MDQKSKIQKSAIEQSAMINEIIKRDNKFYSINKNFHLDLKTLKIIATKPNNVKKENFDWEKRAQAIPEELRNKIKYDLFKVPNEKYKYPMTQSQEIGWDAATGLNTQLRKSKCGCDVTKYADEYYKLTKRSPYATKEAKTEANKQA